MPVEARRELAGVLRQARVLLALPGNDFAWSSREDASAALAELDRHIAVIEGGQLPPQLDLAVLFAPTGPMQAVSLSRPRTLEFLVVSARFDAAAQRVCGQTARSESGVAGFVFQFGYESPQQS